MKQSVVVTLLSIMIVLSLIAIGLTWYSAYYEPVGEYEDDMIIGEERNEGESEVCLDLGCFEDTKFVGSKNSDKYYPCDCRYAKNINQENIVCFNSVEDAETQGRIRVEC